MIAISPKLSEFLTKATQTSDLETAFWRVCNEYLTMKIAALHTIIADYEHKWGMSFDEFSRQSREGTLKENIYSWEVEQDFWEWERADTLLRQYEDMIL